MMVIAKPWFILRKYILTLARFDLFLQGALLIVVFLESNVYLLLRRNAGTGYLTSINEDWVKLGVGGAEFLLGGLVAWCGRGWRHFALSGWLGITAVSGLIVLAFPFPTSGRPSVELCGGGPITEYSEQLNVQTAEDDLLVPRTVFLVLTAILCGLTKISVWAHGITYLDDHEPQSGPYFYGILTPIGRMLKNKALMLQTFALSLINTAVFGYVNYDTASIQAKFQVETIRQDMRTSRTILEIFRSLVVIFFVSIFRMRFSGRRSDGVKSHTASKVGGLVCVLVAAFFAVLTGLSCRRGELAGLNGEYQQPGCSSGCGCASETYGFSPVCILNTSTTYFSPCHAGCRQYEDLNGFLIFDNCDCGPHRAIRGSCTLPDCWLLYNIYIVFFTVALAASAAACLMQGMAILRSVPRRDKPIAVGVSFAIVGLLSNVIGHFVYMVISHFTCAYEQDGECLFHHFTVWTIGLASIILSVLSGTFSILASRYRVTPKVLITNIDDS